MDLLSPAMGELKAIETVNDEVFAAKMLGDGVAILPMDQRIVAPVSAEVTAIFPTGHAFGLKTNEGVEILLHLGIDTVELNGKFFESKVQLNQTVQAGDLLAEMDCGEIKKAGYDTDILMIITNSAGKTITSFTPTGKVTFDTPILTIK
ncbi:hypothetical protein IGI39_000350 [Enterococcus sp. AZ135]|uniref:PTS sugar transporter subunit IIA n=1 Tax=unclassified Enterococcus TaxID=2608891 RepID=UPI003F20AADA